MPLIELNYKTCYRGCQFELWLFKEIKPVSILDKSSPLWGKNKPEERRFEALTSADIGKEVVFLSYEIEYGWYTNLARL